MPRKLHSLPSTGRSVRSVSDNTDLAPKPRIAESGSRRRPVDRAHIKRVAARLFRERGFHGTSMQDISDELGLLKGSLYHHIRSKDELLTAVLADSVNDVLARVRAAERSAAAPREQLQAVIEAEILAMSEHLDELGIWLAERTRMPETLSEIARQGRAVDRVLLNVIERGNEVGEWSLVDTRRPFIAIRDMVAAFATWYDPGGKLQAQEVARTYARYAEHILDGESRPAVQARRRRSS